MHKKLQVWSQIMFFYENMIFDRHQNQFCGI